MKTLDPDLVVRRQEEASFHDKMREQIVGYSKDFKTSWIHLGRLLYAAHEDKLYHKWGFEKFEHYAEREVGLKKTTCMKMLKSYIFVENNAPKYLKEEYAQSRTARHVPGVDEVNVVRLAGNRKELNKEDFQQIKTAVFEKGKEASVVRKDLAAIIKERKFVDPEEEREQRNELALKRLCESLKNFEKDAETLQLCSADLIEEARKLKDKLQSELKPAKT